MTDKTNVMRILEQHGIPFVPHAYDPAETEGVKVAALVGKDPDSVFKTLVTRAGQEFLVFVIPVSCTLDLKKAARAAAVKSVEMIRQKELFPLTGYVHGGCSPVGMKKAFRTFVDETAQLFGSICVSAGKLGHQVELSPSDLCGLIGAPYADLTA